MYRPILATLVLIQAVLLAPAAWAHDPSEHAADAEAPDCSKMHESMHGTEKKADDPMAEAMMKKCMKQGHHDAAAHDPEAGEKGETGHDAHHGDAPPAEEKD